MTIKANPKEVFDKWSIPELQEWLDSTESLDLDKLGSGFVSLDVWLIESQNEVEREKAFGLTHKLLDRLNELLSRSQELSQPVLAQIFGILTTLLAEAGPYRFETNKTETETIAKTILGPMRNIRQKTVEVAKVYFRRKEFSPLGEAIEQEINPLLDSMLDEGRYMPFRVIQATKVVEKLHELKIRVEDIESEEATALLSLIDEIYSLKYPRFGTSGLRGRWRMDFTYKKVNHTVQAICDYMKAYDIPPYVRPEAEDLSGKWVVIGYDTRRNARRVAGWAAQVCLHNGFKVCFASRPTPTPVGIYQAIKVVGEKNIAGIITCTASHNPPEWQGIKFNPRKGFPAPTHLTDIIAARANHKQLLDMPPQKFNLEEVVQEFDLLEKVVHESDLDLLEETNQKFDWEEATERYVEFDPIVGYSKWIRKNGQKNQRIEIDFQAIRNYFSDKLVIIDEMHGAGRGYLSRILGESGVPHQIIHAETDERLGKLEYANPELPYIQPLIDAVKKQGATLGLGLDTDADRFGVVDEDGRYFRPNQILAMLTKYLGVDRELKGRVVITQTCLPMIDKIAARIPGNEAHKPAAAPKVIPPYVDHPFYIGSIGQPEKTMNSLYRNVFVVPVGIKYIAEIPTLNNSYERIPEEELGPDWMDKLLLGGEESSGLTTQGHVPDKDGVWANLLIMDMIAHHKKPLAKIWKDVFKELKDYRESFGGRVDIDASDEAKEKVISYYLDDFKKSQPSQVKKIAGYEVDYLGGVRFDLAEIFLKDEAGGDHFLRVRASGTEPINRIYFESSDEDGAKRLRDEALKKLDEFSVEAIQNAYSLWRLVDILAFTDFTEIERPSSQLLQKAVQQVMAEKNWSVEDLAGKLEKKSKVVEQRNARVVEAWRQWLKKNQT